MNYLQVPDDPSAIVWRAADGNSGIIREGADGWEDYIQWCASGNIAPRYGQARASDGAQEELDWCDGELTRAGQEIYKHDDGDPGAIATADAWRNYRKALRAWPEHESFPEVDKRPQSPL